MGIKKLYSELERTLSVGRLHTYRKWTSNELQNTLDLYSLNLKISSSFYASLNNLEVVIRNSVNDQMVFAWGVDWLSRSEITIDELQQKRIKEAVFHLKDNSISDDENNFQIVSNLSFGFWTTLFSPKNHILWGEHLHKIFKSKQPIQRKDISLSLNELRILRNKIAHYETILYLDLENLYHKCRKLIGLISPITLEWSDSLSDFPEVHPGIPIIVNDRVNPDLDLSSYRFEKINFNTKSPSK